jgi:hypothetical protein
MSSVEPRYISDAERRALTQYDHFTNIWRDIDDGRLESLRSNQDLPILINDKQKGVTPLFLVRQGPVLVPSFGGALPCSELEHPLSSLTWAHLTSYFSL